jgi:sulfite reductase (NADPH) flavoprotein alpha-component
MTLHGRLVEDDHRHGVSCNQCHAPGGFRHGILPTEDEASAVNPDQLQQLCGASDCHGYTSHDLNRDFLLSDMHDLDWVPGYILNISVSDIWQTSQWSRVLLMIIPPVVLFVVVGLFWSILMRGQTDALPIFGGKRFERLFLVRKPRPKKAKPIQYTTNRWLHLIRKREWLRRAMSFRHKQNQNTD